MKIIHTADWHLGNVFHRHNRDDEFRHFFAWLLDTLRREQPDALLVAGDVFDTANPPAAAEEMLYSFLHAATEAVSGLQVVLLAGNHDSAARLEAPQALLHQRNIYVRGLIKRSADAVDYAHYLLPLSLRTDSEACAVCYAVPHLRPSEFGPQKSAEEALKDMFGGLDKALRHSPFKGLPVVACAHYYAKGADIAAEHSERLVVGGEDRVDANLMGRSVSYAALGHIHKAQQVNPNTWYAGSPLPMSFSERTYKRGVQLVELSADGKTTVSQLPYTPLRQLVSIPARGAVRAADVLAEIEQLPLRTDNDDGSCWPYVEIRVREEQPEPELLHRVMDALSCRAVHFCRMTRETPADETTETDAEAGEPLRDITPLQLVEQVFDARYHAPLPDALRVRFDEAERAVQAENQAL